ncbi:S9 family peptidase [Pseudotabrizicola sp. 4114]|uniref:alpha/beta hydrolase family protein n=1 Tax=Pseudotabrizicola sp. 4114 TaxID=2817731 RepID=UPI00285EDAC4|nr:dipeptidyl aminopeptidase/acylaminoacyl peptidase [Pseudorhodobacter sp. 4114]
MSEPDPIPIETLFAAPAFSGAQISPDGRRIAYLARWQGRLNVFLHVIDQKMGWKLDGDRRLTADAHRNIESYVWSPDGDAIFYLQDKDGDENWHLFRKAVADVSARPVDLTPFPGTRVMGFSFSTADPNKIFVQMNMRDPTLIDLHVLDVTTGDSRMIGKDPGRFVYWIPMSNGLPHAFIIDPGGEYVLARFEDDDFVPLASFAGEDYPFAPTPIVPTPDGTGLWLGSNRGSDRTRLVRVDLTTGEESEVASHPVFSLDTPRPEADQRFAPSLILNPVTGDLLGARFLGERQVIQPLDTQFAAVLTKLNAISGGDLGHVSCDADGRRWVAEFTTDQDPGVTWFYDHMTGESQIIGRRRPNLDTRKLSPVRPVMVTSRDGLALPCHLTLPVDRAPHLLPTVLLVHGGPWYRDSASYDPEVQFFASRGYAVLQVNMRGSTGYGKAFTQAAKGEFAGRMHDDLIDALDWAIAGSYTDPDRVAVYGSSYGGYAALVGASFTPDRFAAAIDYAGMSDLRTLVADQPSFLREALLNNWIAYTGDPTVGADNATMLARSPVSRLDRIECPLLVIHGAQDVRVKLEQAQAVVESLQKRGHDVEFLVNEKEGHWFINENSNFELYRKIEAFLARHLKNEAS